MKRNIRTIIIVVILLALLIGAYFFVQNLKTDNKEEIQKTPAEKIDYLITEKLDEISYIQYKTGVADYILHNKKTPTIEGYSSHIVDNGKLESMIMSTVSTSFSNDMGKQEDLAKYGLDNEEKFVLFKLKNGDERKIIIGNPTHLNGEYYARKAGDNTVYTLSSQASELLMCNPDLLRDTTVCIVDNYSISKFAVEHSGVKVLEVEKDDNYAKENDFMQSNYIIRFPYNNVEANNDVINVLFEKISSVYATEIVEEDPKDLSVYGLDKPNVFTVKDKERTSVVKMGNYSDDGAVYVMRDDIPVVFKAVCSFAEPVKNIVPDEYIARYVHIFKINDIETVVAEKASETYTLKIIEKSKDSFEYKINDKIKVEDNFRTAYEAVISPIANKITDENITGEEACKITFSFKNKSVKSFVYYEYDNKNYIVKADNGLTCLVKKESVDNIFDVLKK